VATALAEFRLSYNERRPHEALGMKRPVEPISEAAELQENVQSGSIQRAAMCGD